jgi:hypothetical protein
VPRPSSKTSHWGMHCPPEPIGLPHPTAFDKKCELLKLETFDQQRESSELRVWVQKNMKLYYVPETLLKVWDLHVFVDVY